MDKGLNFKEVSELITYIQENNSWENMYENRNRKIIKYYKMFVDTRTGDVWKIEFYSITNKGHTPDPMSFRTENGYNLKDAIYEYLDRIEI